MDIFAIIIFCSLIAFTFSYKEFFLSRSSNINGQRNDLCTKYDKGSNDFEELCYEKDISYNTQLYIDDSIYYVALDFTVPYSWLKSSGCVGDSKSQNKECKIIENGEKLASKKQFNHLNARYKLFGRSTQNKLEQSATIYGSSDIIKGPLQKIQYAQIYAKDSKAMREFFKLLMISLFLAPEKQKIIIQNVNIITAQKLSGNINILSDGGISMNLEDKNSFLSQFFDDSIKQRIITIYIHPQSHSGMLSVGQISLKNSRQMPSQIKWLPYNRDKMSYLSLTAKSISYISINPKDHKQSKKLTIQVSSNIYFTCSSSFIYLTKDHIKWLSKMIEEQTNGQCSIRSNKHFVCKWKQIQDKKDALFYRLSFEIGQQQLDIPITTLITISEDLLIQFGIKQSAYSDKIILGQPLFEQHVAYIDYGNHKIGFAETIYRNNQHTMALIYFLRFIIFSTIILFFLYICYKPLSKIKSKIDRIKNRIKFNRQSFQSIASTQFS